MRVDVREFWETSQSPIVYKLSEVWDMVSSETEESQVLLRMCMYVQ